MTKTLEQVINLMNSDPDYRAQYFQNPASFLRNELGVIIPPELESQLKAMVSQMQQHIGIDLTFALPGSGTPRKSDIYP